MPWWAWLLIVGAVVAGGVAIYFATTEESVYTNIENGLLGLAGLIF